MFQRRSVLFLLLLLLPALFLPSCSPRQRKYSPKNTPVSEAEQMSMPRADPAYLQYLERQSMLAKSSEMAKVVSGSELAWQAGAGSPEKLLDHADIWLQIHPLTMLTSSRSTVFSQLAGSSTMPVMREIGAKGLYVAPIQSNGALWAENSPSVNTGDDVVQYDFSRIAGDEQQYRRLMSSLIDSHALLGSDLVPAATGIGPDFFLAARNVREYPGVYCMVEIPKTLWKLLPDVTSEWGHAALGQAQVAALNREGLLPRAMRDEASSLMRMGGWAATGVVRGVDGNNYRWVYRYYQSPEFAVLNWEDPSQSAHRILSGSAVRQVGLQGQAFVGLRFEAFQGLEAAPDGANANSFSVEPARTASATMSREIRRYGGWSWVRDNDLPLNAVRDYLAAGVDFVFDSVFSPAGEHALLTGDASFARFMADEALRLNIDTRRLVHVMPAQDGINYSLPYLGYLAAEAGGSRAASFRSSVQGAMRAKAAQISPVPVQDDCLYTTAAGLAALALNVPSATEAQKRVQDIEKGHSLLIFFKAMQPGVMMLAGQDLSGVLPLEAASLSGLTAGKSVANASKGTYGLSSSANSLVVSNLGMPRAPQLYAPPDMQVHQRDSFLKRIGSFLKLRGETGIAKGQLVARPATKGDGSIALLSRLPGNAWLLTVCNFSRASVTENITLSDVPGAAISRVTPVATGGSHSISGKNVSIRLGPWEGRALLFGGGDVSREPANQADENLTPIPEPSGPAADVTADAPPGADR